MPEPSAKRRKLGAGNDTRITDPRFSNVQSDPRYRLPSKSQKVKLDKRFTQKFRNEDFTRRAKVDRYGRRIEGDTERRRLEQKFDLEDDELSDEPDDDDEVQAELARVERKHDFLREGKDVDSSEDSSTDEDSDSDTENTEESAPAAEKEDVPLGEVSTRLAVVNLDWDNIRAADLLAVFSSFLPAGGRLLKVSVYPSEFGKERMEREEMEGPPKEIFMQKDGSSGTDEDSDSEAEIEENDEEVKASFIKPDDGSEFDSQALRQYQLERLRYYYAVLAFSSKEVAKSIYDAVDGAEYLSTANFFDLRFIPESMDFTDDRPRDECEHLPTGYKPNEFVTDALQHSKVRLTWDAEDRSRKEAQARAFKGGQKEIDENDIKAYLGSDSSSEDSEDEDIDDNDGLVNVDETPKSKKEIERQKARALLGLAPEPTKKSSKKAKESHVGDIQITFSSGLSGGNDHKRSVFENSPEPEETTVEKYKRKEKERKQKRKERMKAARSGDPESTEKEVRNAVARDEAQEDLGFDDPFFADSAKETSKMNKIRKEERLKKRWEREAEEAASAKQRAELELLMAENDNEVAQGAGAGGEGHVVKHFDMNEIEKAENGKNKWQKRKEKKSGQARQQNNNNEGVTASVMQDDFKMDTSDARFGKLFENHEFAIDPTKPGLRQTKAMKELMEEGRRRKQAGSKSTMGKMDGNGMPSPGTNDRGAKHRGSRAPQDRANDEVRDLVAKIKRRADGGKAV